MSVKAQRLSKWLVQLGYCATRREAESFLDHHRVEWKGEPVDHPEIKFVPDEVTIDGEKMDPARLLIMLHKPAGYVCSHEDSGLRVFDLLPDRFRFRQPKLLSVGRLDKDTTGLLLLTDDGMLVHKLTHPRQHVPKLYEVGLAQPLKGHEAGKFAAGTLMLEGETTPLQPAQMEVVDATHARLTIHEGRYHQVKRMFLSVGNEVVTLHRATVGNVTLGPLPEGKWRVIDGEEEAQLFK